MFQMYGLYFLASLSIYVSDVRSLFFGFSLNLCFRCNDLLELVQTTRHFNLLQKTAEVGGAGTKGLDALVREIHEEFTSSMETFGYVVEDILDVQDNHTFEKGFFHFRSVVKVRIMVTLSVYSI